MIRFWIFRAKERVLFLTILRLEFNKTYILILFTEALRWKSYLKRANKCVRGKASRCDERSKSTAARVARSACSTCWSLDQGYWSHTKVTNHNLKRQLNKMAVYLLLSDQHYVSDYHWSVWLEASWGRRDTSHLLDGHPIVCSLYLYFSCRYQCELSFILADYHVPIQSLSASYYIFRVPPSAAF